jgi:hypothetical protein
MRGCPLTTLREDVGCIARVHETIKILPGLFKTILTEGSCSHGERSIDDGMAFFAFVRVR